MKDEFDFLVPWFGDVVPWRWDHPNATQYRSGGGLSYGPISWKENKPFKASFKFSAFNCSTSSTKVELKNTATDKAFMIREPEFIEAMEQLAVVHGVFIGEWIFKKTSGKFYGLKLSY